jgi:hypothetical protein
VKKLETKACCPAALQLQLYALQPLDFFIPLASLPSTDTTHDAPALLRYSPKGGWRPV